MESKSKSWKKNAVLVLGLCALAGMLAPATHAADHRLRVRVDEPFEIDGRILDPAVVVVRQVGQYNPVETLNEVWVGKTSLGLVIARSHETEGVAEDHSMLFARNGEGRLVLVGVAFRGEPAMTLHRVGAPDPEPVAQTATLVVHDR